MDILIKYDKTTESFSVKEKGSDLNVQVGDTFNNTEESFVYLTVNMIEEEHGDQNFNAVG